MTMGKRQLVLAALVVALGAAVYLNWVFTGNNNGQLPATQAVASQTGRQLGQTLMVNASAVSGKNAASAVSGKAVSGKVAAVSGASKTTKTTDAYFSEAILNRQKSWDEAKETMAKVLQDTKASDSVKKDAYAKAQALAQNFVRVADIENLIKAKGFSDCVVSLDNNQCSVVVKAKQDAQTDAQKDAVIINDIVSSQTGLSFDKIKIIERT